MSIPTITPRRKPTLSEEEIRRRVREVAEEEVGGWEKLIKETAEEAFLIGMIAGALIILVSLVIAHLMDLLE